MRALRDMGQAGGGPIETKHSRLTGLATFVTTKSRGPIPVTGPALARAEERALAFINAYGSAFGLQDASQVRVARIPSLDAVGMDHVRLQQLHKGVPVTGGELTVHLRGGGVIAVLAKTLSELKDIGTIPSLRPSDALRIAGEVLAKHLGVTDAVLGTPGLEVFNRGILEGTRHPTRLAWFIEATKLDLREFIWVDAHTGGLLLRFSQLPDALNRFVYSAQNSSALPGTLIRVEGGPSTGDPDADLAYTYSGDTYQHFFSQHGRNSWDNAGASLISTVHYCPSPFSCPYGNAFWNGAQMVYGDGFPQADDVVAHELTHAVTEYSANLFYYMQSGALNESFSDIFGETVDLTNGAGTDTSSVRWLIGEDIPGVGAFRNMMNPTAFGDPGKMSDPQFACADSDSSDAGGVHSNSGVPNHAYALMVDGGSYNGATISGIGLTKAAKIQYRALTHYLISASDFLDNYNALNQACTDLIGTAGITAADCTEVGKALDAVEMSNPWPCSPAQPVVPAQCPFAQTPKRLFFDDLEGGGGNWVPQTSVGSNLWFLGSFFATSGVSHLFGMDPQTQADSSVEMNLDVAIPADGARMQFNHAYGFENSGATAYYDGGVVEYSSNGGAAWSDAGALITGGAAYGGTLSTGFNNPLGGRSAFVRDTFGYTATQLDLSSLAGQSVRFRFRIGSDTSIDDAGWFIDDVQIYTCVPTLVDHYYNSILRRAPDPGGKAYWEGEVTRIRALGMDLKEAYRVMAGQFFNSGEYLGFNRTNTDFVTDLYNTFFQRSPDAGGLNFWVGLLAAGLPRDIVMFSFLFSTEFANFMTGLYGDTSVRAEVDGVVDFYRGFLGRLADNGGFTFWLGRFRTAQCQGAAALIAEVESISKQFAESPEYLNRARTNAQYVADLYYAFLRRGAESSGFDFWLDKLNSGARTRDQLRQDFLQSPEFQGRVNAIINEGCLR